MSNGRLLNIDSRPSDSPMVESIWRSQSSEPGHFLSIASSHWEMIVSQHEGRIYFSSLRQGQQTGQSKKCRFCSRHARPHAL
jgi:hypothetical protein